MRFQLLSVVAGAIAFAALAASAPAPQYGADTCAPNPTTVFVTVPGVSTVTVHDAPTSTVYLTVPSYAVVQVSELPTTTLTRLYRSTLTSTTTTDISTIHGVAPLGSSIDNGAATPTSEISYEATVTKTAIAETVYVTVGPAPALSSTSTGPLSFIVAGGTTYWGGGVAPASTASFIVVTSAVTVVPVITPLSSVETPESTSTLTLQTTIFQTHQYTITETRVVPNTAATVVSAPTSAGTGGPFTGVAHGGWNATSNVWSYPGGASKAVAHVSSSEVTFITAEPTFDIYATRSPISFTASAAQSGFNALSTNAASSISTVNGAWTTAVISGQTVSWSGAQRTNSSSLAAISTSSAPYTEKSAVPPYANSTSALSTLPSTATSTVRVASSTSGYSYPWSSATNTSSALGVAVSPSTSTSLDGNSHSWAGGASITLPSSTQTASGFNSSSSTAVGVAVSGSPVFTSSSSASGMAAGPYGSRISSPPVNSYTSSTPSVTAGQPSTSPGFTTSSALSAATSGSSSVSPTYTPVSSSSSSSNGTLSSSISSIVAASSTAPSVSYSQSSSAASVTTSSQTPTSASSTASPTPSQCGEVGDFCLNFDDIPPLSVGNQSINDVQPEPVFNPYHQFDFSDGFVVVPPPTDPYLPSSPPLLVEFIPNFNVNGTNTQSGPNTEEFGYSGDIGNGDHGLTGCFGFNFYGASFGCDSRGPDCDFTFTGFQVDPTTQQSIEIAQETFAVPACPALQNCSLVPITFTNEFMDLDSIRINVTVAGAPKIWWMDDLNLGWYNNSCATGLCRINTHIH